MSLNPSLTLKEIINPALKKYTKLTEKDLKEDQFVTKIQDYNSATAISQVLRQHANAFHDNSKLKTCLNVIVDKLHTLSTTPALCEVASPQVVSLRDCIV